MKRYCVAGLIVGLVIPAVSMGLTMNATVDDDFTAATAGWGETAFASLQSALPAMEEGGTVAVNAGTYTEAGQIVIDRNVTIAGAGAASVTVKPAQDTGGTGDARGWFLVQAGKSLTLSGATLDGDAPTRAVHTAIRSWGNLNISSCAFKNIMFTPGSYDGRAVGPYAGTNTITGCTLTNIGRLGALVYGAGTAATLTDCTYTGKGAGDWLDYAFEAGGGGQLTVNNCRISDCVGVASVDGSTSAGILATTYFGPGTSANITGSIFTRCTTAIAVGYDSSDTSVVTAYNNAFVGSGVDTAVSTNGIAVVNAENNWWGATDGPGPVGPGSGDTVGVNVDYDPWLGKPSQANVLYLVPTAQSIFIQPGESITVDMNVANLSTMVNACQAMLGYSSDYFTAAATGAVQAAGSGPWDEVIYDSTKLPVALAGEIDTAIGVYAEGVSGTANDSTVCKIVLTANDPVPDGLTQIVFRPDADPDPGLVKSTFLSDAIGAAIWPAKVDGTNIYVDGTPPADFAVSASGTCTNTDPLLTFATTDALAGVAGYELFIDAVSAGAITSPHTLDTSAMPSGVYAITVKATDRAGNETLSSPLTVSVDKSAPTISAISATQGGSDVLCPAEAVQGTVDIYVTVTDDGCANLVVPPSVDVAGIASATYMDVAGDTYHYTIAIGPAVANGSHTIAVVATDDLGNSVSDASEAVCVDKNQITGQISLEGFVGSARTVTFVAKGGTTELGQWTVDVSGFSAGTAPFVLTRVPAGITSLSAKTAWNLRQRVPVVLQSDGQSIVSFTGADELLAGDLDGSNSVNVLDYGRLKAGWQPINNPGMDVTGDGMVNTADYSYIRLNWFKVGDPR